MLIKRFAAITAGLGAAGAAAGSVVGFGFAMCLLVLSYLQGSLPELLLGLVAVTALTVAGAAAGAVLGPIAAWLLMRHVPLWRAIGGTTLGALAAMLAGVGVGIVTGIGDNGFLLYPVLGLGASSVYLNVSTPRESRRIGAPSGRFLPGE